MSKIDLFKNKLRGFTLIELLVVISIISFLSSVVFTSLTKTRIRARDAQRIQTARQIAIALEQYEATFNTYKVAGSGLGDSGTGYVAKGGAGGYTNSVLSGLKSAGLFSSVNLSDPVFGADNYYLGLCTSTNSYNVFVKLEQPEFSGATSSIINSCGGIEASLQGFSFIGSTAGGSAAGSAGLSSSGGGGGGITSGFSGASDAIVDQAGLSYNMVVGEDGKIWLDRNLGATRVATALNDTLAYGDLYQFGRGRDGHQLRTSGTSVSSSSLDMPGNTFIINGVTPWDWHITQENYYWIGTNGGPNNPCPSGFRIPTSVELFALVNAIPNFITATCATGSQCSIVAANSKLKLPSSGWRNKADGTFMNQGQNGLYWSSSLNSNPYASGLYWTPAKVDYSTYNQYRSNAFAVRCIKG